MDDISNGQVALYKYTSEGNTPSHIELINPTDCLLLRQLITLGIASHLSLGDCRPPTGPGPSLHPIKVAEKAPILR